MRWTPEQLKDYISNRQVSVQPNMIEADPGPEAKLQSKILKWCKDWGRPCLSLRQSRKAKGFIEPGWPDLTIIMPYKVLFIELKAKGGRLSDEQKVMRNMFVHFNHEIHEVRSFKSFLKLVTE